MYGIKVHQAVLVANECETGASAHIVTENYDEGPIIVQRRIPILEGVTPGSLAARVLEVEHELYIDTIAEISKGEKILLPSRAPMRLKSLARVCSTKACSFAEKESGIGKRRRSFASALHEAEVDVIAISSLLGHVHVQTTAV